MWRTRRPIGPCLRAPIRSRRCTPDVETRKTPRTLPVASASRQSIDRRAGSMRLFARACGASLALVAAGCAGGSPSSSSTNTPVASSATGEWFVERAAATGLVFTHVNGMTGRFYEPEIIGPGVALFDYDNDGDLDVFVAQGYSLEPQS